VVDVVVLVAALRLEVVGEAAELLMQQLEQRPLSPHSQPRME
jgi:hypothetical protein